MDAVFLVGTMWSGKTYQLLQAINAARVRNQSIGVFEHPKNDRNSTRDLSSLCFQTSTFKIEDFRKSYDLLVFDEVHFYECFGNINELLLAIELIREYSPTATVIFSGLKYDFYNDLRPFVVWDYLTQKFTNVEIRPLFTTNPCCNCGKWVGVNYTVNIDPKKGRVGDHYANCCKKCAEKYLESYKVFKGTQCTN